MYTLHAILKMYCHINYAAACCFHTSCLAPQADEKIFCIQISEKVYLILHDARLYFVIV